MSKLDFPADEFSARLERVRRTIGAAGLDWFIAVHPVSIHWLTGADAKGYQAFQCMFVSAHGDPLIVLTRESERSEFQDDSLADNIVTWGGAEPEDPISAFDAVATKLGLKHRRVGLETSAFYLHPHHHLRIRDCLGDALAAEPANLIHDLKLVKSPREIAYVRKAAAIADRSIETLRRALAPGRSELEMAAEIYHTILSSGGGQPVTPVNLVSGPRASFSHGGPTERILAIGDFGNAEYCVPYRRYSASIGRSFSIGPPTSRMRELHDVALAASDACIAAIAADVPAAVPHRAAKAVIALAGLDRSRVHISGYGLAPAFPPATGEPAQLFEGSAYTLRAGMVLSVCPPIFSAEERLGARIVDTVLVTANGAERLSTVSRDLIVAS